MKWCSLSHDYALNSQACTHSQLSASGPALKGGLQSQRGFTLSKPLTSVKGILHFPHPMKERLRMTYKKRLALKECSLQVGGVSFTPRALAVRRPRHALVSHASVFLQPGCPWLPCTCGHLHFWKLPCIFLDSIPVESFCEAFFDHNAFSYLWIHKVFIFCGELGGRNPEGFQELSSVASVRPTRNKGIRPQGTEPTPSRAAWGPSAGERLHESLPVACRLEKSPVLPKVSSVMSYSAVSHNRKWSAFLIHKLRHKRGWRVPGCISWSPREQPLFPSLHGSDSSCS